MYFCQQNITYKGNTQLKRPPCNVLGTSLKDEKEEEKGEVLEETEEQEEEGKGRRRKIIMIRSEFSKECRRWHMGPRAGAVKTEKESS